MIWRIDVITALAFFMIENKGHSWMKGAMIATRPSIIALTAS
ncbi:MAG: hypothetical protein ABIE92_01825 [bacterium]